MGLSSLVCCVLSWFEYSCNTHGMKHTSKTMCSKCTISCHEGVGYCISPLDHSVLVQSGICHFRCHRDMRRHHVSRSGSLIGLRSVARLGWRDVSGG